jgi:hypothetical protein
MTDDLSSNQKRVQYENCGGLSPQEEPLEMPAQVALLLEKIPFVKPR